MKNWTKIDLEQKQKHIAVTHPKETGTCCTALEQEQKSTTLHVVVKYTEDQLCNVKFRGEQQLLNTQELHKVTPGEVGRENNIKAFCVSHHWIFARMDGLLWRNHWNIVKNRN